MNFTILLLSSTAPKALFAADDLTAELAGYLKGKKITAEILETQYSCMELDKMLERGLSQINNLEKALVSARKNTRLAGLLPEITAWGKYKSDDKLYLYQRNNIAVGKDYVTVGPDDNNTTYGDLNSFEAGGKIRFDLTKLLYNPDTLKFGEQEQKLYFLKIEMVERLSGIYYFSAMLRAAKELKSEIPEEKQTLFDIIDKKNNGWLKLYAGFDLYKCGEDGGD